MKKTGLILCMFLLALVNTVEARKAKEKPSNKEINNQSEINYNKNNGCRNAAGHAQNFQKPAAPFSDHILNLAANEELVYGNIGLNDNGSVKYTFPMTRKPNQSKQIYKREMRMPYGAQPLLRGGQMRVDNNPKDYDMYDYFVVLNGNKMGPYDRIYDIHQDDGDIDNWITPDGKHISFAGVKGQKYYPIFGNNDIGITFWSVVQAPAYDPTSSNTTFAMEWRPGDARLIEKGRIKLRGWKVIKDIRYAYNNDDLLFVGAKDDKRKKYIYLNHESIDGPFNLVNQIGFLPGTNKPYFNAWENIIINNASKAKHSVLIDDKKFDFTIDQQVGNLKIAAPWVCFTVSEKNKNYTGNDRYKKKSVEIWKYNYRSGELVKHGKYAYRASIHETGDQLYFTTYDTDGSSLLVNFNGKILERVTPEERGKGGAALRLSPNGDYYTFYRKNYNQPYTLKKNGEIFKIDGVDKIMGIETLKFSPKTGKLNLVVTKDQSVGSEDRTVINGDFRFDIKGRAMGDWMHFATESNDVFSRKEFKREGERNFTAQLYKNGKLACDLSFKSIVEFTMSPDASRYAALVTLEKHDDFMGQYFTENHFMDNKRKLLVDGKIVEGTFGAPVWSNKKNKFLVLKQEGNSIRLVEL